MSEKTVIRYIIERVTDVLYYSGLTLEILVLLVFAGHFLKRSKSPLKSAYFYILFWGYLFEAFYEVGFTFQRYVTQYIDLPFIEPLQNIIEWYMYLFLAPANVLLSLNRFTAIFLIWKHEIIWTKWFPLILFSLFIYPFIVGGFTFFTDIKCRLDIYNPECQKFFHEDFLRSTISTGVCAILSLIIGFSTATAYRIKFSDTTETQTNQLKIEHKLLLQSVWSASLFGLYAFLGSLYPFFYPLKNDPDYFVIGHVYGIMFDLTFLKKNISL